MRPILGLKIEMHEKYQSRIFSIVYYEDRGNLNDICVFCVKKHNRTLLQPVFSLRRIHGDLRVFFMPCTSFSKILVILVIRGDLCCSHTKKQILTHAIQTILSLYSVGEYLWSFMEAERTGFEPVIRF